MLKRLHQLLKDTLDSGIDEEPLDDAAEIRLATAVLLVEIARADAGEDEVERRLAENLLRNYFELDNEQGRELIALASKRADEAISLFEFTNRLKDALDENGRADMIEMLWDIVYADGELGRYEEHLMRRIAELLYVPHAEFIRRKLLAAERAAETGTG